MQLALVPPPKPFITPLPFILGGERPKECVPPYMLPLLRLLLKELKLLRLPLGEGGKRVREGEAGEERVLLKCPLEETALRFRKEGGCTLELGRKKDLGWGALMKGAVEGEEDEWELEGGDRAS